MKTQHNWLYAGPNRPKNHAAQQQPPKPPSEDHKSLHEQRHDEVNLESAKETSVPLAGSGNKRRAVTIATMSNKKLQRATAAKVEYQRLLSGATLD
jgi:hypothetical protein